MSKRGDILDAAIAVLAERGLHDTPVPLIAGRAGVAVGSMYRHFRSKDDLIVALYREILNGAAEAAFGTIPADAPARVRHRRAWFGLAEYFTGRPTSFQVMRQMSALAPGMPGVRDAQVEFDRALTRLLVDAQSAREIVGVRLDVLRAHFIGPLFELLGQWCEKPSDVPDRRMLADAFDMTWNAIAEPGER